MALNVERRATVHAERDLRAGVARFLRPRGVPASVRRLRGDVALRDALLATACCLVLSAIGGVGAVLIFGAPSNPPGVLHPPGLISGLGSVPDVLVAPFARWDSAWYLWTALHGYGPSGSPPGQFFPLYPLIVFLVSRVGPGVLVAGLLTSVVATVVGLRLMWKLTDLEFGEAHPDAPRLAVFATALFPTGFFLTAVYPQSLFLALSIGAMIAARKGRWVWAGVLGGLGAAAHSLGFVIIVPLGLLYLQAKHWRLRADVLWLALVPAGFGLFMAWLALKGLDPLSPLYAHKTWLRNNTNPFSGLWLAVRAAWAGVRQIVSQQSAHVYWVPGIAYGYDAMTTARDNVEQFVFLIGAAVAGIASVCRLPLAYAAYVLALLLVLVSDPIQALPLDGLSRYVAVLFTVPMMIAWGLSRHPRWRVPVLGASALGLVYFSGSFATWHFVA